MIPRFDRQLAREGRAEKLLLSGDGARDNEQVVAARELLNLSFARRLLSEDILAVLLEVAWTLCGNRLEQRR